MKDIMNIIQEKGKRPEDDDLFGNIYLLNSKKNKLVAFQEDEENTYYYVGRDSILQSPKDRSKNSFAIISPQIVEKEVGGFAIIKVDTKKAEISFLAQVNEEEQKLISSSFDTYTKTWDVRIHEDDKRIPSNMQESLETLEKRKVAEEDGILFSETFRNMIAEIENVYPKENKNNK